MTQLAVAFSGLVAPAAVGNIALNTRYLQTSGLSPTIAGASVGVAQVAQFCSYFVLLVISGVLAGTGPAVSFSPSPVLVAAHPRRRHPRCSGCSPCRRSGRCSPTGCCRRSSRRCLRCSPCSSTRRSSSSCSVARCCSTCRSSRPSSARRGPSAPTHPSPPSRSSTSPAPSSARRCRRRAVSAASRPRCRSASSPSASTAAPPSRRSCSTVSRPTGCRSRSAGSRSTGCRRSGPSTARLTAYAHGAVTDRRAASAAEGGYRRAMTVRRIMGLETEYGISVPGRPDGQPDVPLGTGHQRVCRGPGDPLQPVELGLRLRGPAARRARLAARPADRRPEPADRRRGPDARQRRADQRRPLLRRPRPPGVQLARGHPAARRRHVGPRR